jgi:hypothetical protein
VPASDSALFDGSDLRGKTVYFRLSAVDGQNHESALGNEVVLSVTGVFGEEGPALPQGLVLYPNYPNPFNSSTEIRYFIPKASPRGSQAELLVYDVMGRRVRKLFEGNAAPGEHRALWDGTNDAGRPTASGLYFITLKLGSDFRTLKAVLLN